MVEQTYSAVPTAAPANVTNVEVVAPATLSAGYKFDAVYEGSTFPVTVPEGGVVKGQKFTTTFVPPSAGETTPATADLGEPPHGRWKDGLFDCFRFGVLHPHFLNACCCPQILMAQVLTRMKLNWVGSPAPESEWRATFRRILYIVIIFFALSSLISPPAPDFDVLDDGTIVQTSPPPPVWRVICSNLLNLAFGLYTLIVLMKLRRAVREKYGIPEERCLGWEDLCCSFWCGCCTVAQVARHTADYEEKRAVCCSETGLPSTAPIMIV